MPIALNGTIIDSGFFNAEDELQNAIAKNPQILFEEDEPKAYLVKREVTLPSAGRLDILLVDENGVPVAVEVKLGKNIQSRREVVAQVFDYAADLNSLTVDELDDLVGQNLQNILVAQDSKKFQGLLINGLPIEFEPNWSKGLGRIRLFIDTAQTADPATIATFIKAFINRTLPDISQAVAQINAKNQQQRLVPSNCEINH